MGRLLAKELAKRQAVLVLWDIQERKLQGVVDEIYRESGTDVHAYVCDCSNREDIYKVADQVRREVGDVTVLINNAGVMSGQTIVDSSDESIEKTFRVNTLAHFWVRNLSGLYILLLCTLRSIRRATLSRWHSNVIMT